MTTRRIAPAPGAGPAAVAVLGALVRPALWVLGVALALVLSIGLSVGVWSGTLVAAAWGAGLLIVSLWTHEAGHLAVLRLFPGYSSEGIVCSRGPSLWCEVPALSPLVGAATALAGPVLGAVSVGAFSGVAPTWICLTLVVVHLVNLLPFLPDGRHLWLSILEHLLGLVRRAVVVYGFQSKDPGSP